MELDWNIAGWAVLLWAFMSFFLFLPKFLGMAMFPVKDVIIIMVVLLPISYGIVYWKANS
jgi:hypothetical protein